jgi:hypothetical protein
MMGCINIAIPERTSEGIIQIFVCISLVFLFFYSCLRGELELID